MSAAAQPSASAAPAMNTFDKATRASHALFRLVKSRNIDIAACENVVLELRGFALDPEHVEELRKRVFQVLSPTDEHMQDQRPLLERCGVLIVSGMVCLDRPDLPDLDDETATFNLGRAA